MPLDNPASSAPIFEFDWDANNNPIYIGKAAPASATSSAVWQIRKLAFDVNNNVTSILYANGSLAFNQAWTGRTGLSYS